MKTGMIIYVIGGLIVIAWDIKDLIDQKEIRGRDVVILIFFSLLSWLTVFIAVVYEFWNKAIWKKK